MAILLKEQIKQLSSYLSSVLLDGVDISALYIIQAQLTTIKASVKPSTLLMSCFSNFEVKKILTYSKDYFQRLKYSSNADNLQPQSYNDNLNRFNVSLKQLEEKPLKQISIVSGRIMGTLDEWSALNTKTDILRGKLGTLTQYSLCLSSDDNLKEELQSLICLIDISTIDKQFKNLAESTECFSMPEDSQITQPVRHLKVSDIACFLRSLLIWSKSILEQISEFFRIIEIIKADTSFDGESEIQNRMTRHHKGQTLIHLPTQGSSGVKQRMSNNTEYLQRDKQNDVKKQPLPLRKKKYSLNTVDSKDDFRPLRPMNILSDFDWSNNNRDRKRVREERAAPGGEKTCHKCQIY